VVVVVVCAFANSIGEVIFQQNVMDSYVKQDSFRKIFRFSKPGSAPWPPNLPPPRICVYQQIEFFEIFTPQHLCFLSFLRLCLHYHRL